MTPSLDSPNALQQLTQWLQLTQKNEAGEDVLISPSLWQLLTLLMLLARLIDLKTDQRNDHLARARALAHDACQQLEMSETETQALLRQADAQGPMLAQQLATGDVPLENCHAWHDYLMRSIQQVLEGV